MKTRKFELGEKVSIFLYDIPDGFANVVAVGRKFCKIQRENAVYTSGIQFDLVTGKPNIESSGFSIKKIA